MSGTMEPCSCCGGVGLTGHPDDPAATCPRCDGSGGVAQNGPAPARNARVTERNEGAALKARTYRAVEMFGRWVVQTEMSCINGLSAWVTLADCGAPDPRDQMCGFDPEEWASRIADALEAAHAR